MASKIRPVSQSSRASQSHIASENSEVEMTSWATLVMEAYWPTKYPRVIQTVKGMIRPDRAAMAAFSRNPARHEIPADGSPERITLPIANMIAMARRCAVQKAVQRCEAAGWTEDAVIELIRASVELGRALAAYDDLKRKSTIQSRPRSKSKHERIRADYDRLLSEAGLRARVGPIWRQLAQTHGLGVRQIQDICRPRS